MIWVINGDRVVIIEYGNRIRKVNAMLFKITY